MHQSFLRFIPLAVRGALLVAIALLCLPAAAQAHAILIESQPAAGQVVAPGQAELVLRYNSRIDAARSRIRLGRAGGDEQVLPIAHGTTPDTLTATAELAAGSYVLHWQVLAVDGHITRGELRFMVAPGGAGPRGAGKGTGS